MDLECWFLLVIGCGLLWCICRTECYMRRESESDRERCLRECGFVEGFGCEGVEGFG